MFDIGGQELILILIVVLMLFGPKKLPELMQSFGKGVREFRRAQQQFNDHINTAFREEEQRQNSAQSSPPPPAAIARPGSNPYKREEPAAALNEAEQPEADQPAEQSSQQEASAISESAPFAPSQPHEQRQAATPTNGTTVTPKLPIE
jgi:TatA/E family protein of Tat protein translocase